MKTHYLAMALLVCCSASSRLMAATALAAVPGMDAAQVANINAQIEANAEKDAKEKFKGIGFGVGLSLVVDSGGDDRITSASVVNGVVRVDEESNSQARALLETHFFFTSDEKLLGRAAGDVGHGPFMALQAGSEDVIEAIGLGYMVGFRRAGAQDGSSWNIGVAYMVDNKAKVLGDGISANAPLPAGETAVRMKTQSEDSFALVFSFQF